MRARASAMKRSRSTGALTARDVFERKVYVIPAHMEGLSWNPVNCPY